MVEKRNRCPWCGDYELYMRYHDEEWGRLDFNDRRLFEYLVLESAQAGLSWITILRKREAYREAFYGFDPEKVARLTAADVDRLTQFEGIVRNRRKIEATIGNAASFLEVVAEFCSFDAYVRQFLYGGEPIDNRPECLYDIPATSLESDAMSADMRRRGFKFFGSTMCYAFLQSAGYVNDHFVGCFCREQ